MSAQFEEYQYSMYFNNVLSLGPKILNDYVVHITTIDGVAINTAANYYRDLILFFKFILLFRGKDLDFSDYKAEEDYEKIVHVIEPLVNEVFIRSIRRDDIMKFLFHLKNDNNNSSPGRNRRLSAIRSFFNYVDDELKIIDFNPASNIKLAKKDKTLPIYLTLEESKALLAAVPPSNNYARDYCILTLFLNLGLRISELVNINLQDYSEGKLKITGKGSKQRVVYFNTACQKAYDYYLERRMSDYLIKHEFRDALFVSELGRRLSTKRVYDIVLNCISLAGLDKKGLSPHKLRHTAATLMYQYGGVDIRSLKDVLGHESISTTQIYTHVNNQLIKEATSKNPLSDYTKEDNNEN